MSPSCASVRRNPPLHLGQARISSRSLLIAIGDSSSVSIRDSGGHWWRRDTNRLSYFGRNEIEEPRFIAGVHRNGQPQSVYRNARMRKPFELHEVFFGGDDP